MHKTLVRKFYLSFFNRSLFSNSEISSTPSPSTAVIANLTTGSRSCASMGNHFRANIRFMRHLLPTKVRLIFVWNHPQFMTELLVHTIKLETRLTAIWDDIIRYSFGKYKNRFHCSSLLSSGELSLTFSSVF